MDGKNTKLSGVCMWWCESPRFLYTRILNVSNVTELTFTDMEALWSYIDFPFALTLKILFDSHTLQVVTAHDLAHAVFRPC